MTYTDDARPQKEGTPEQRREHQSPTLDQPHYLPLPRDTANQTPEKSFVVTWLFAWLLGFLGADRFYLGKVGTAVLKLVTFAGFGVWWLVDLILVLAGAQRDNRGNRLAGYDAQRKVAWIVTGAILALSLVFSGVTGGSAVNRPAASSSDVTSEASTDASNTEDSAREQPQDAASPENEPEEPSAQSWADNQFGSFAPLTQSGTGDNVITLPKGVTAGIITATHDGSSNFVINVLDAANQSTADLLVNTIGTYTGTTAYGLTAPGDGVSLQITADGNWSFTLSPISAAPALVDAGTGDAVFLYTGPAGPLTASHSGESNFVVTEETGESFRFGLLINEIGAYTGTVPMSAGPSVVTVRADGAWTLQAG